MEGQINGWTDRRIDCQINEWTDSIDIKHVWYGRLKI